MHDATSPVRKAGLISVALIAGLVPVVSASPTVLFGHALLYDQTWLPRLVTYSVLVLAGLIAVSVAQIQGDPARMLRAAVLWVPLFGWMGLATLVGLEPLTSLAGYYDDWHGLAAWLLYAAIFMLAVQVVRDADATRTVMRATLVSGVLLSAYGLMQYAGIDPLGLATEGRALSLLGNSDVFGGYLAFPIGAGLALSLSSKRTSHAVMELLGASLCAAALLTTFTRSAWIGGAVTLAVVAYAGRHRVMRVRPIVRLVFIAGLVTILAIAVQSSVGRHDTSNVVDRVVQANSGDLVGRPLTWATSLRAIADRPLVGWGPDSLHLVYTRFMPAEDTIVAADSHDLLLDVAVGGGVPAAVLLVVLLGALLYPAIRDLPRTDASASRFVMVGPLAAAAGYLVYRLASPGVLMDGQLWLAVGLCAAPYATVREAPRWAPRVALVLLAGLSALTLFAGTRALVADSHYARAEELDWPDRLEHAEMAARLNPFAAQYLATEATTRGNLWIEHSRTSGAAENRAEFDAAEAGLHELVSRFPNDSLHFKNLAHVRNEGAAYFGEVALSARAAEAAREGLLIDPRNIDLQGELQRAQADLGTR